MTDKMAPGTLFVGEYRIVRPLRSGAMGDVYVVEQVNTGRLRALKVLSADIIAEPGARERFEREARVGGRIDSDHIVEVVAAGVDPSTGSPFLVMELLKGEDLEELSEQLQRLPLGDVGEILSQISHGLERAHALGIVHRDIKPANVFLASPRRKGATFTVKILDFGIAKAVENHKLTGSQPLGTPLYMAPEQMENASDVTPAADVWALGLVAFRLLTGFDFWVAANDTLAALIREVVVTPLQLATQRAQALGARDRLPPGFDAWFARCVVRSPAARFADAGECVRAFAELIPPGAENGAVVEWLNATRTTADGAPASNVDRMVPVVSGGGGSSGISVAEAVPKSVPPVSTRREPSRFPRGAALGVAVAIAAGAGIYVVAARTPADSMKVAASKPIEQKPTPAPSATPVPACPDDMVLIPAGSFFMGSLELENARPPHKVTLPAYCLDRHEVTAAAYDACARDGNCLRAPKDVHYPDMTAAEHTTFSALCTSERPELANHPINCIDFQMADNYCRTAGGRTKEGGARLPTEAEWEFAARGSSQRTYPWGDEAPDATRLNACGTECSDWFEKHQLHSRAMYPQNDGYAGTAPVGSFPAGASQHGVFDLAGNVWEWTADWYGAYAQEGAGDGQGPRSGTERVVRGGSFNGSMNDWAKPAYRWKTTPDVYNHVIGFRCARDKT